MNRSDASTAMTSNQEVKHLIRSDFADIVIKVDDDLYYLDRLKLVLKSDYLEKLLFIEDFQEKKSDLIELPIMDSDTFSAVVDVIYGKGICSVLNGKNCVSLLIAMDYLQMEIDLQEYADSIKKFGCDSHMKQSIFQLYNFVVGNQNFEVLLQTVFEYLSSHLKDIRGCEEFLSLPPEHFIEIISVKRHSFSIELSLEFCQICVEWIWHDVETRLPHTLMIINAAKYALKFPYGINDKNVLTNLRGIYREKNQNKFMEYFHRLLVHRGEIITVFKKPTPTATNDGNKRKIKSIRFSENGERDKLAKYLKNGDFSDVTVTVEGKTYKLHRVKLRSVSGYFQDLFAAELASKANVQPEGTLETSIQRNKSNEYLLDEIDRTTFEAFINYIYFNEAIGFTSDNIICFLKAALILKFEELVNKCKSWMENNVEEISQELAIEILNITHGNTNFREFYTFYFCKRVPVEWPEIGNSVMLFRSLTFDMLQEILLTDTFHFSSFWITIPNFCTDDHNKLLDICSKWVIHDVENRYHLIPRIALAINCNGTVDYEDYEMETSADFNNCSQTFVRDKLWEILCSTSLVPSDVSLPNARKEFKEEPAFISWTNKNEINILSGDLDDIASLSYHKNECCLRDDMPLSATIVHDNVFILADHDQFLQHLFFQVYNLSLKKFVSLSGFSWRIVASDKYSSMDTRYRLLNCCNEVYCCFDNGCVLKYSIQLNRWFKISTCNSYSGTRFASNGKKLYRMYKIGDSSYVVDFYDFERNMWISFPTASVRMDHNYDSLIDLTFVNGDEQLCALFISSLNLFKKNSRVWRKFEFPAMIYCNRFTSVFAVTQCITGIMLFAENKLYHFSESERNGDWWELRKEFPSKIYNSIYAIHRPNVCTD